MDGGTQNLNVSRDVTTPIPWTVCRPSTGTSYDQPVHQIWSLYVNSLRRYERRRKMIKIGVDWRLGVTQGHRKHCHSAYDFLFDFNGNYTSILYRFRFIAHFSSKVTNFNPLHLHLSPMGWSPSNFAVNFPRRGWSRLNFAMILGIRKLDSWGYRVVLFAWSYI